MRKNLQLDKEIEKAIKFLVASIEKSGHNPKPVVLHSIRVGLYLNKQRYNKNIVIAGIIHDLLEDSETSTEEIKERFGNKIADLVSANSFNEAIKDKKERYYESFTRCFSAGKDAMVIKAADILDNSHYYQLAEDRELYQWLLAKMKHFIDHSAEVLKNNYVWKELKRQYENLKNNSFLRFARESQL